METTYAIITTLKGNKEQLPFGKFSIGKDHASAVTIFNMMKGKTEPTHTCTFEIELSQNISGLPVPVGKKHCNLEELKENVGLISKEVFRIAQLEAGNVVPLK